MPQFFCWNNKPTENQRIFVWKKNYKIQIKKLSWDFHKANLELNLILSFFSFCFVTLPPSTSTRSNKKETGATPTAVLTSVEASASAAPALPVHFSLPPPERGRPLSGPVVTGIFHGEVDWKSTLNFWWKNPLSIHFHIIYCSKCPAVDPIESMYPKKMRVFFAFFNHLRLWKLHGFQSVHLLRNFYVKGFIACCPAMTCRQWNLSERYV